MISENELRSMYYNKKMSAPEIGREIGVTGVTVRNWMKSYGIERRTNSESRLLQSLPVPISKEELEIMYRDEGMSMCKIAEEMGFSYSTVNKLIKKYNIYVRSLSESLVGKYIGEDASNWRGGISFLPYCDKFDNQFKEAVR